jgi:polysaccharide export outer membrane protein
MNNIFKQLPSALILYLVFNFAVNAETTPLLPPGAPNATPAATAPAQVKPDTTNHYLLAPGDFIEISVWKEEGMQKDQILLAPDGTISFPLAGTIVAAGKPMFVLEDAIASRLADYITDPIVTVKLLQSNGNSIFVIGKVNKPGQYPANRRIDVLQALSLAGGLTVFAKESAIHVIRRVGNETKAIPFDYDDVIDGDDLEQNIILEPGDTVSVP